HAHGHQAGVLTAVLATSLGRRRPVLVISWHNTPPAGGLAGRLAPVAQRLQARTADLLTGASEDLVHVAEGLGARRAELAAVAAPGTGPWTGDRPTERAAVAAELGIDGQAAWAL